MSLEKKFINETIGYGVFALKPIQKGEFICIYGGDLISRHEARERWLKYHEVQKHEYQFDLGYKQLVLDPTLKTEKGFGPFMNHSRLQPNVVAKKQKKPALNVYFYALRDISVGEELRYDYGLRYEEWQRDS